MRQKLSRYRKKVLLPSTVLKPNPNRSNPVRKRGIFGNNSPFCHAEVSGTVNLEQTSHMVSKGCSSKTPILAGYGTATNEWILCQVLPVDREGWAELCFKTTRLGEEADNHSQAMIT
ncbi:hypothetical protein RB195_009314 [Necator americanus]|uniref:Uncharacterized protein n=1 Tax=Necator americanus TaxID=51031 RepID=A0ABR1CSS5_NECAM